MKTQLQPISGLDPLQSIEDLAQYLGVPVTSIYDGRVIDVAVMDADWGRPTRADVLQRILA
jgi:hypothetical protein